jgi:hypothetical protein
MYEAQTPPSPFSSKWLTMIDLLVSKTLFLLKRMGEVLAPLVDSMVSQGPRQEHAYRNTRQMDKLEGVKELGMSCIQSSSGCCISSRSSRNTFASTRELKVATNFAG